MLKASLALAVCGSLAGCYEHHTADEELLDIPFQADAFPPGVDAGVHKDGSTGSTCAGTDPVALFFCSLQQTPATTGTTGGSTTPDIGSLLTGLLGGGTGTTGSNSQDPLAALAGLAGLLGGNTGTTGGTGTSGNPLADLLTQLGIPTTPATGATTNPVRTRDAGAGQMGVTLPTTEDCTNPTDQLTQFLCGLQTQMQQKPVDAGAPKADAATTFVQ